MKISELKEIILKDKPENIEFEDYQGNTLFYISDLDYADMENKTARLQLNIRPNESIRI